MEAPVFVQVKDAGDERSLVDIFGKVERIGVDAGLLRGVALGADVGERRGVLTDEDEGQAGGDAALLEASGAAGGLLPNLGGDGVAVDDVGGD